MERNDVTSVCFEIVDGHAMLVSNCPPQPSPYTEFGTHGQNARSETQMLPYFRCNRTPRTRMHVRHAWPDSCLSCSFHQYRLADWLRLFACSLWTGAQTVMFYALNHTPTHEQTHNNQQQPQITLSAKQSSFIHGSKLTVGEYVLSDSE